MILYKNRPPHIYLNDVIYFLSARTLEGIEFFNTAGKKQILFEVIKKSMGIFSCNLIAWVILNNHYHLLLKVKMGNQLPNLVRNIHTNSSRLLNKFENRQTRSIWWNYWDHSIRDDKDFWKHFNYIHHNPIKHDYTKKMEDYKFSSYNEWLKRNGQEWLYSSFELYPIIDFRIGGFA